MIIKDIRLRLGDAFIRFECEPKVCEHAWEPHLWDHGEAYCAKCGSLARWVNDPRVAAEASKEQG